MSRTLYEKRGRRYVPVAEMDAFGGMTEGTYLVVVRPGSGLSALRVVEPASAEVEAALHTARGAMVEAMRAQCTAGRDEVRADVDAPTLRRAWAAWRAIAGDVTMHFRGVSMVDVVDAGIAVIRAQVKP